jgi:hypothetical protein
VYPGLQLGTDTTSATLVPLGAPSVNASPLDVEVTETFESGSRNDTPATATPVQPDKLYLSFEQTQNDTDWYSLAVPPAGTVTTFTLSHLTNDKDLVVYAPGGTQLRSAPIESSPIESSPIESSPVTDPDPTLQHKTDNLQPARRPGRADRVVAALEPRRRRHLGQQRHERRPGHGRVHRRRR